MFAGKHVTLVGSLFLLQGCVTSQLLDEAIKHEQDVIHVVQSAHQTTDGLVICLRGQRAGTSEQSDYAYELPVMQPEAFDENESVKYYQARSHGLVQALLSRKLVKDGCEIAPNAKALPLTRLYRRSAMALQVEHIIPPALVVFYNQSEEVVGLAYVTQTPIACEARAVLISAEEAEVTNYMLLAMTPFAVAADVVLIAGTLYVIGHGNGHVYLDVPVNDHHVSDASHSSQANYISAQRCK